MKNLRHLIRGHHDKVNISIPVHNDAVTVQIMNINAPFSGNGNYRVFIVDLSGGRKLVGSPTRMNEAVDLAVETLLKLQEEAYS